MLFPLKDWCTPKQVLVNELAELETLEWSENNGYEGSLCEMEDCSRMYIGSTMTKPEIIKELNSRQRLQ